MIIGKGIGVEVFHGLAFESIWRMLWRLPATSVPPHFHTPEKLFQANACVEYAGTTQLTDSPQAAQEAGRR